MTAEIHIAEHGARHALEIGVEIPMWKIAKTFADNFPRIGAHIEASGATCSGAPYGRYLEVDWSCMDGGGFFAMLKMMLTQKLKLQVGMPVAEPVPGSGDITSVEIPGGKFVETIHRGPYQKLGDTYKKLLAWADAQGVRLDDVSIESYINDPTTVPKDQIETLIQVRVLDS